MTFRLKTWLAGKREAASKDLWVCGGQFCLGLPGSCVCVWWWCWGSSIDDQWAERRRELCEKSKPQITRFLPMPHRGPTAMRKEALMQVLTVRSRGLEISTKECLRLRGEEEEVLQKCLRRNTSNFLPIQGRPNRSGQAEGPGPKVGLCLASSMASAMLVKPQKVLVGQNGGARPHRWVKQGIPKLVGPVVMEG